MKQATHSGLTRTGARWAAIAALVAGVFAWAPTSRAQVLAQPDVTGDQLLYLFDARSGRVPFLSVANPSDDAVFVDVALWNSALDRVLARETVLLEGAANIVIDPTSFAGGGAAGNGGLAVITPVAGANDRRPVVPPAPLAGGFTLANTNLEAGFGQNPLGRFAVNGAGRTQPAGTLVDGAAVFYERFAPAAMMIPTYYDPATLSPVEDDGNRVLLVGFVDEYGAGAFGVGPLSIDVPTTFFDNQGTNLGTSDTGLDGVLLTNLQELASGIAIDGASGKVFFEIAENEGNVAGIFSQALGTYASAQVLPGVGSVPGGGSGAPTIACPGGTATITENITSDIVWPANCEILLDGTIFVDAGTTLTIQAGTVVRGKKFPNNPPPSALIFRTGSRIDAIGTRNNPILFTSDQPEGSRAPGDWAGLALNGLAPVNCPGGECAAEGLVDTVFGGDDPDDSSGRMRFLRVEFAGRELSPDNELNVFTLNGVGFGTSIEYVQAHMGLDDGIETFGGTVGMKNMVSTGAADDQFDWQIGYTGPVQWLFVQQSGSNLDTGGSRGFEGDNNGDGNDLLPRSKPLLCNATLLGAKGQPGGDVDARCMRLREGTGGLIYNSICANWNTGGIRVSDEATFANACSSTSPQELSGELMVQSTILYNVGSDGTSYCRDDATGECSTTRDLCDMWAATEYPLIEGRDPGFPGACDSGFCQPVPTGDVASAADCSELDPFFESTDYMGAFAPGASAWTGGGSWFSTDLN